MPRVSQAAADAGDQHAADLAEPLLAGALAEPDRMMEQVRRIAPLDTTVLLE